MEFQEKIILRFTDLYKVPSSNSIQFGVVFIIVPRRLPPPYAAVAAQISPLQALTRTNSARGQLKLDLVVDLRSNCVS